jgi:uncharacterized membrane protein YeiH
MLVAEGVMTAFFGGIVRNVLCGEISLFGRRSTQPLPRARSSILYAFRLIHSAGHQ